MHKITFQDVLKIRSAGSRLSVCMHGRRQARAGSSGREGFLWKARLVHLTLLEQSVLTAGLGHTCPPICGRQSLQGPRNAGEIPSWVLRSR